MQAGLLLETGEAREVHDFAVLLGFGAAAINPYLALDTVHHLTTRDQAQAPVADGVTGDAEPIVLPGQDAQRVNSCGDWSPDGKRLVFVSVVNE